LGTAQLPGRFLQRREYSDGFGRPLQQRAQADDLVIDDLGLPLDPASPPTPVLAHIAPPDSPRVIVSGWQLYDNKGRVVKKWEPDFADGWSYGETLGGPVAVTTYYDPRGVAVRTVHPDGSQQRVLPGVPPDPRNPDVFDPTPWESYVYDGNDNAGRTDRDRSQAWIDHWDTPSSAAVDPLGRVIQNVQRAAGGRKLITVHRYDIVGNLLETTDPIGRQVFNARYDQLGRPWRTGLLDAGITRTVPDAVGGTVEQRDSKEAFTLTGFDPLHRPVQRWARDGNGRIPTLREVTVYGEQAGLADPAAHNLLERVYLAYDEAGLVRTPDYDLAGNVSDKQRRVLASGVLLSGLPGAGGNWSRTSYQVDWQPRNGQSLDALAEKLLGSDSFDVATSYDALGRPTAVVAPTDVTAVAPPGPGHRATLVPTYNRSGALTHLEMDGTVYIDRIAHNARGQRLLCVLGNGAMTRYAYDPNTFRLARLRSEPAAPTAPEGWRSAGTAFQDHGYSYDQVGNLWALLDTTPGGGIAPQPDRLPRAFSYDPLYQLLSATGREADLPSTVPPWQDTPPGPDVTQVRGYSETYGYDDVGNLITLAHRTPPSPAADAGYTRTYTLLAGHDRLNTVTIGPNQYQYTYDDCGNLTSETTSRHFEWDAHNRLATFQVQTGSQPPSAYAQYRYDGAGQRVLKLVLDQAGKPTTTVYIGDLFERLLIGPDNAQTTHDSVHIEDGTKRVATVQIGDPVPGDRSPPVVYRLGDHLGSINVTVDRGAAIVNREEYTPYGETSYGSYPKKRYRYTGKERDEESGLYYHGARYYAPWICRWASTDPLTTSKNSSYAYVRNQPLRLIDPAGAEPVPAIDHLRAAPSRRTSSSERMTKAQRELEHNFFATKSPRQRAEWARSEVEKFRQEDLAARVPKPGTISEAVWTLGEATGLHSIARAVTGADEWAHELSWGDRVGEAIKGGLTLAVTGIDIASGIGTAREAYFKTSTRLLTANEKMTLAIAESNQEAVTVYKLMPVSEITYQLRKGAFVTGDDLSSLGLREAKTRLDVLHPSGLSGRYSQACVWQEVETTYGNLEIPTALNIEVPTYRTSVPDIRGVTGAKFPDVAASEFTLKNPTPLSVLPRPLKP
jgi:RHS repeat-associated protein